MTAEEIIKALKCLPAEDRRRVAKHLALELSRPDGEDEPADLIARVLPDVLVKAADWAHYVSGKEVVERHGGRVVLAPLAEGRSTTDIIRKIRGD